jgi:hypothetical protein
VVVCVMDRGGVRAIDLGCDQIADDGIVLRETKR